LMWVKEIQERIGIFMKRCSVQDDFIVLRHFNEELVNSWPFHYVHKVYDIFDL
jgi:hypothetical protein